MAEQQNQEVNQATAFKSGFIGIVGPTNSGKSTLMNALVGKKVSIVSPKQQTTYHGVRGIVNTDEEQIIYVDTPGFQKHPDRVAKMLNQVADKNAKEADVLVWVFDASTGRTYEQISNMKDRIAGYRGAATSVCVLNKVDKIDKLELLPMIENLTKLEIFSDIIPMSASKGDGVDRLVKVIKPQLPAGEKLFPKEMLTDRDEDFRITETIREKIYQVTRQELPYSVWIEMEHFEAVEHEKSKVPTMRAVIHVDTASRKAILIGRGGEMLKRIGVAARKDIEAMVGHQICLKLHIDVDKDWKDDASRLNRYLEME